MRELWHYPPDRPWPCGIARPPRDDVHVQLRNHIAERCDVQLLAFGDFFQCPCNTGNLRHQLRLLDLVEIDDFHNFRPARHQQQPRIMRILDDEHAAQRQVANVDGIFVEPRMERPGGFLRRHGYFPVLPGQDPVTPATNALSAILYKSCNSPAPACFPGRLAPNKGREIGGGRATRQPGQVRKEAALTRSGSGRSSVSYLFFERIAQKSNSVLAPDLFLVPQAGLERQSIADRSMTDAGIPATPPTEPESGHQGGFDPGGPPQAGRPTPAVARGKPP